MNGVEWESKVCGREKEDYCRIRKRETKGKKQEGKQPSEARPMKNMAKGECSFRSQQAPQFCITCILKLFLAHAYEHVSNALVLEFPLTDTIRIGQPLSLFCPPNHRCIITFRQHIVNTIQMNIGFLQQTRNAAMCVLHIIFIFL